MKVLNTTKQTTIASDVRTALTFAQRLKGLIGRSSLKEGEALLLPQCRSIHMFFMRFAIDAIFVNNENKVVGLCPGLKPFRLSPIFFEAGYCVEVAAGTIERSGTALGDYLNIVD